MGYLLGEKDGITSQTFHPESRRESFIVHYEDPAPHPEWLWTDLDELIETLEALRTWAHEQGIDTCKIKPPTVMVELPRWLTENYAASSKSGEHLFEACRKALEEEGAS